MAARENEIGRCRCPVCGSDQARLRVSKRALSYVTCGHCKSQTFARGDHADTALRGHHIPEAPAATPDTPAPAPATPAPATPAPATPAPRKSFMNW